MPGIENELRGEDVFLSFEHALETGNEHILVVPFVNESAVDARDRRQRLGRPGPEDVVEGLGKDGLFPVRRLRTGSFHDFPLFMISMPFSLFVYFALSSPRRD